MPSPESRHRILVLVTGGTLTMRADAAGGLAPTQGGAELIGRIPELPEIADLEFRTLGNLDSANAQPSLWTEIAAAIYEAYDDFDGFVVTHGTDTMVYSAAAISFFLQELGKPIVFTGAQVPLTQIGTDGRSNLVNAVRVAASDLAEVCVVFGTRIIRGTRARKTSTSDLEAYESINEAALGTIGLSLRLAPHARLRARHRRPLYSPHIRPDVARFPVWPGIKPDILRFLASTHAGVVIEGFGLGNLPADSDSSLIPAIRETTENGVPVLVCTQCVVGSTAMEFYQVGQGALDAGAIPAMDMTPETTQVKLMWALGQTRDVRQVASMMLKNYVGELLFAI